MLPSRHIIISLPLGIAAGFFTHSATAGLLCLMSGILIDIDHIIEYIIHYGLRTFNFREIYRACTKMPKRPQEGGVGRIHLLFHSIEIAILLWIGFAFVKNIYLLAIALGYSGHIILDASGNIMKPQFYFIAMRIKNGFNTEKLIRNE